MWAHVTLFWTWSIPGKSSLGRESAWLLRNDRDDNCFRCGGVLYLLEAPSNPNSAVAGTSGTSFALCNTPLLSPVRGRCELLAKRKQSADNVRFWVAPCGVWVATKSSLYVFFPQVYVSNGLFTIMIGRRPCGIHSWNLSVAESDLKIWFRNRFFSAAQESALVSRMHT